MFQPQTLSFLVHCSETSRQDFRLANLNRTANLRKQMRAIHEEVVRLEAEALAAEYLAELRRTLMQPSLFPGIEPDLGQAAGF